MGGIIDNSTDSTLIVSDVLVDQLRIKVVDCRSNEVIKSARVKKIVITVGAKTFTKEFDLKKDTKLTITKGKEIDDSMSALIKLGYGTEEEKKEAKGKYNSTWVKHYNNYWAARLPDFPSLDAKETPSTSMLEHIITEYGCHQATDETGFLKVCIPHYADGNTNPILNTKVEVGFFDFPVVVERTLTEILNVCRASEQMSNTGMTVKWGGTQSTVWNKGFGWKIHQGNLVSELKVSEELNVQLIKSSRVFLPNFLSIFYSAEQENPAHIVLLAMKWCQPVWDGIADPTDSELRQNRYVVSTGGTFVNKKDGDMWIKDLNMHIVTRYVPGGVNPYGHYYGFYETKLGQHRSGRTSKHHGLDFYGGTSDGVTPVFAISGGYFVKNTSSGLAKFMGTLYLFQDTVLVGKPQVVYMHMHKSALHTNKYMMAGTIIGYCGRSGFETTSDPSHMHLEFRPTSTGRAGISKLGDHFTDMGNNINLFQENRYSLMLPCKCVYNTATSLPLNCMFSKVNVLNQCWAIQEFPYTKERLSYSSNNATEHQPDEMRKDVQSIVKFICPHVFSTNGNQIARLQAELLYLFTNPLAATRGNYGSIVVQKLGSYKIEQKVTYINGIKTNTKTIDGIKLLLEAFQLTLDGSDVRKTEEILTTSKIQTDATKKKITLPAHTNEFLKRYLNEAISENTLVNDTYNWFIKLNFR